MVYIYKQGITVIKMISTVNEHFILASQLLYRQYKHWNSL